MCIARGNPYTGILSIFNTGISADNLVLIYEDGKETRDFVSYKMKDNAFTAVSNPDALNQTAKEIDGKLVQQRIDYWMNLFFKFDKGTYATRKESYLIRTETTINNPKSLGLQKPVLYLQACLWTGLGCNDRLLNCCADVDLASIYDGETDLFDQPVLDHKGMKVTAPDLRKDRQLSLCRELLKPKYAVHGFLGMKPWNLIANIQFLDIKTCFFVIPVLHTIQIIFKNDYTRRGDRKCYQ